MAKIYANHKSHVIHAALMGYYRFTNVEQAKLQLQIIRDTYLISRHMLHPDTPESLVLWIRGYGVTEADKKRGMLGHFAKVSCQQDKAGWAFAVEKIVDDVPHPQKRRVPMQHPNWGHAILQKVENKQVYASIDEAQAELTTLQQEYPHATVPGKHCLFVAIYKKPEEKDKKDMRVKRYVLEIDVLPEGGFIIKSKEKKPKTPKPLPPKPKPKTKAKPPKEPVGFFT